MLGYYVNVSKERVMYTSPHHLPMILLDDYTHNCRVNENIYQRHATRSLTGRALTPV